MAQLKKHWQGTSLAGLVILVALVIWSRSLTHQVVLADPEPPQNPPALTEMQRNLVERVLAEVSLDRDALVALNPSANAAESVLSAARTWALDNQGTLATLSSTIDEKAQAVYNLEKAIALGPFNENHASQLATARSDLLSAKASYRAAFSTLESSVTQLLTEGQRSTWTAIKTGFGQQMPWRMLDFNDSQRIAFGDALRRYQARRAGANSENELNAATTEWNNYLSQILTSPQQTAITSYNSNYETASGTVTNAWNTVLAVG